MSDDKPLNIGDNQNRDNPLALTQPVPLTLQPAEVYLRSLGEGSRRTMREALDTIAKLLTDNQCDATTLNWSKLKYQHTAIIRSILMEKYSPAMANKMLCALRRTLKEAWRLELTTREQYARAADIASVRGKRLLKGRALNDAEITTLWKHCLDDNSNLGLRDTALLGILMVGLRRSEVTSLDLSHFKPRNCSLHIHNSKGNLDRVVYLPPKGVKVIKEWVKFRKKQPGPLLYPFSRGHNIIYRRMSDQGILKALQTRGKIAGLDGFTVHDFRRTFITNLLYAGVDLITVKELAGHASADTTAMYDMRGEEAKRQAINSINIPIPEPDKRKTRKINSKISSLKCPNCKSEELIRNGFQILADGNKHQSYRCKKCSYAFTPLLSVPDK
ncbi:tyrosine-type recombinase/integrase [Calothrix sp. CCY 0018]|uniref:tyrosine-type recombinase/integrase n=1 Tax=Calothrix sp. CCY 0018 TaxID=3103864 RepID=UPI0039C5B54E